MSESTTGEQPAFRPVSTGEHPATNVEVKTAVTWGMLKTAGALVVAVFLGGWAAYATVAHAATDMVDAGLAPVRTQVTEVERRLERHIDEEARHHAASEEKATEMQADIRALYKAVMTGKAQPRLEGDGGK